MTPADTRAVLERLIAEGRSAREQWRVEGHAVLADNVCIKLPLSYAEAVLTALAGERTPAGLVARVEILRKAYDDAALSDGAFRVAAQVLLWPAEITEADIARTHELAEKYGWK